MSISFNVLSDKQHACLSHDFIVLKASGHITRDKVAQWIERGWPVEILRQFEAIQPRLLGGMRPAAVRPRSAARANIHLSRALQIRPGQEAFPLPTEAVRAVAEYLPPLERQGRIAAVNGDLYQQMRRMNEEALLLRERHCQALADAEAELNRALVNVCDERLITQLRQIVRERKEVVTREANRPIEESIEQLMQANRQRLEKGLQTCRNGRIDHNRRNPEYRLGNYADRRDVRRLRNPNRPGLEHRLFEIVRQEFLEELINMRDK